MNPATWYEIVDAVGSLPTWVVYAVGVAHGVLLATVGVDFAARLWARLREWRAARSA